MSSNSPSPLRPFLGVSPTIRIMVMAWFVAAIGGYALWSAYSANTAAVRDDVNQPPTVPGDLATDTGAGSHKASTETDHNRQQSGPDKVDATSDQGSLTQSEQALLKANMAKHTASANAALRNLGKLKELQAEWAALEATLMNGPTGNRIAGSTKHFPLVVDIWQSERPTVEQIVDWESELNPLTEPISQAASASTTISITDEHAKRLSDLGKELKTQAAEFERQKLLLEAIQRETSALPSGPTTLATALRQHLTQQEQAKAERLAEAGATARAAAEKEQAEKIARAEQELADDKAKQELQRIASEKQLQAEEARVAELQRKAKMEGLKEDAKRTQDAAQEALLNSEMQRDMNEIKGLLAAFVSPGFKHRNDDKKGPASLSVIKARRALEDTQTGMTALLWLACADNDRPHDALPYYIGGNVNWNETNAKPIERAQELLNKYGDLMVKKGLLAE